MKDTDTERKRTIKESYILNDDGGGSHRVKQIEENKVRIQEMLRLYF